MSKKMGELKAIIIKIQHHSQSDQKRYLVGNPFMIPIKHEYCLVYQKSQAQAERKPISVGMGTHTLLHSTISKGFGERVNLQS